MKYMIGNQTLYSYCKQHGLKYITAYQRAKRGLSEQEVIGKLKEDGRHKSPLLKYTINGVPVFKLAKTEKRPHYCYQTTVIRIKQGMTAEQAFYKKVANDK